MINCRYSPEHFSVGDKVRLYIIYEYNYIEFWEGTVLNTRHRSRGQDGLQLIVQKAGIVLNGKIITGGAYCSSKRETSKETRGVDTSKPFKRTYGYETRGLCLVERLTNRKWVIISSKTKK